MTKDAADVADTKDTTDAGKDTKDTAKDTKAADNTILTAKPPLVDADGKFSEGWRDALPEDIRGEKCLDTVTDFANGMKQLVNHKKMIGKDHVVVPNDKSKPEEWDAFYSAAGRPKTAGDYKVEIPEDLAELYPEVRLKKYREIAYSCGASQKQFEAFIKADVQAAQDLLKAEEEREKNQYNEAEKFLRKEFGAAYEERVHVADRIVAEALPNEEQKMEFLEKYRNDPTVIRLLSIVGARLAESKAIIADMTKNTPAEAQAKIKQLQATPGYFQIGSAMKPEEREAITAQINALMHEVYPSPKKAG